MNLRTIEAKGEGGGGRKSGLKKANLVSLPLFCNRILSLWMHGRNWGDCMAFLASKSDLLLGVSNAWPVHNQLLELEEPPKKIARDDLVIKRGLEWR